jgi:hypothetical protein
MYQAGFVMALAWQLGSGGTSVALGGLPKPPSVHVPQNQGRLTATQQDVEIQTIEDVVVRRARMKEVYDQNGKVRQPTPEERAAAKGSTSLPGYKSDVSELKPGQLVKLTLLKKKESKSSSSKDQQNDSGKSSKTEWVSAGTITVVLKNYQDSDNTLTFAVDGATMAGNRHMQAANTGKKNKKDNKVSLDNFRVKMIEIMKEPPDDSKSNKKNK